MTSSSIKYPESFEVLNQEIKNKAIEIYNVLIEKGLEPEQAQCVAIANASCCVYSKAGSAENNDVHLISHSKGWSLVSPDAIIFYFTCASRNEALGRARNKAKSEKLKLFIHGEDGNIIDAESFKVNRPLPGYIQRQFEEENTWVIKAEGAGRSTVFNSKIEALRKAKRPVSRLFNNSQKDRIERNLSFEL